MIYHITQKVVGTLRFAHPTSVKQMKAHHAQRATPLGQHHSAATDASVRLAMTCRNFAARSSQ
jgi:hypothetical protein